MTPKLSIVMPVHNAEATLADAIESCLCQTMEEFELLVMLDCCDDRSSSIPEGFDDPRIHACPIKGSGVPSVATAANFGMMTASTPYIARMDADDIAHPGRLRSQFRLLTRSPDLAGVTGQVHLLTPQGEGMQRYVDWVNGLKTPEDIARERFVECPLIQPSLMIRREVLLQMEGYQSVEWAEDHDLFLRMLERGMRFGKVEEVVLSWRDSANRLTRTHSAYGEEQVWNMKAHHLARLPDLRERGVAICGAGPIGKRLAKLLMKEAVQVHGFFEVNPRRIGEQIGGVPVAGPDEFGVRWRDAVLLSAVGVEGGRERVRALAMSDGYLEGEDFWCCC